MTIENQIKDWEKCNLVLAEIVNAQGNVPNEKFEEYGNVTFEYLKKYNTRFNPMVKPR